MATQIIEVQPYSEKVIHGLGRIIGEHENIQFYTPTKPSRPIDLRRGEILQEEVIAYTHDLAGRIEFVVADS